MPFVLDNPFPVQRLSESIRNAAQTSCSGGEQGYALCSHFSSNAVTGQSDVLIKHAPMSLMPSVCLYSADAALIKVLFTLIKKTFDFKDWTFFLKNRSCFSNASSFISLGVSQSDLL